MSIRSAFVVLLAAVALTSCGRRGALEEPGRAEAAPIAAPAAADPALVPIAPNAASAGELSTLDPGSPGAQELGEGAAAGAPRRRFILDPLL